MRNKITFKPKIAWKWANNYSHTDKMWKKKKKFMKKLADFKKRVSCNATKCFGKIPIAWEQNGSDEDSSTVFQATIVPLRTMVIRRGGNRRHFTERLFYGRRCEIAMCNLVSFRIFDLGNVRVSPSRTRELPLFWLWYIVTTRVRRVSASARLSHLQLLAGQPPVTHRALSESMELLKHR